MPPAAPDPGPRRDIVFQPLGGAAALFDPVRRRVFTLGRDEAVAWCLLNEAGGDAGTAAAALAAASGRGTAEARRWLDAARAQWAATGLLGTPLPAAGVRTARAAATAGGAPPIRPATPAARRHYRLLDSHVEVGFAEASLAEAADAVLPGLPAIRRARTHLSLQRAGKGWVVLAGGEVTVRAPRQAQAVPALRLALTRLALAQAGGFAAVHAAAVARNGRAALLPAPAGAGKSTLAAACALAGWDLLADDTAVLDGAAEATSVRPLPQALCLKRGAWPALAACGARLDTLPVHERLDGRPARYLPAPRPADRPCRLAAIVVPGWRAGAEAGLRRLDPLAGFTALLPQVYPLAGPFDAAALRWMAALVERTPCFLLEYDRLADGVRLLGEALEAA